MHHLNPTVFTASSLVLPWRPIAPCLVNVAKAQWLYMFHEYPARCMCWGDAPKFTLRSLRTLGVYTRISSYRDCTAGTRPANRHRGLWSPTVTSCRPHSKRQLMDGWLAAGGGGLLYTVKCSSAHVQTQSWYHAPPAQHSHTSLLHQSCVAWYSPSLIGCRTC